MHAKNLFPALLALATILTGCISSTPLAPASVATTNSQSSAADGGPVLHTIEWDGHTIAGAAADVPAHFSATEPYTKPVWDEGFLLDIHNVTAMELQMNWSGAPGSRVAFMVHTPDSKLGMLEYQIEGNDVAGSGTGAGTSDHNLCMRIPAADFALFTMSDNMSNMGHWQPMYHPEPAAADIVAHITIRAWGEEAKLVPGPHGHDSLVGGDESGMAALETFVAARSHDACTGKP